MLSETVVADLPSSFKAFELGAVQVVGRKEAVKVYTFFDQDISASTMSDWGSGLKFFYEREWDKAKEVFRSVEHEEQLLRKACKLFISEISRVKAEGTGPEWSGGLKFFQK